MRDCYDTCSIITEFEEGELKVDGNPSHPITNGFLCPKGYNLPKWFDSEERLSSPLVREDGKLLETSWEKAIVKIVEELENVRREEAEESVLVYEYSGDRGVVNYHFPARLFNYLNASFLDSGICSRAGKEALNDVYGTSTGMYPKDLEKENLIIYWGINAKWTNLHGYKLAERKNLEKWTVDVLNTETAKKSEKFFQIKPESDVLFATGIAKVIIENNLYDKEFVSENLYGFEKFRKHIKNTKMNYIENQCGISEEKIKQFAQEFARKKGIIHIGLGLQRNFSGGEAVRTISILPALIGHKKGFIYSTEGLDKSYAEGKFLRTKPESKIPQMMIPEYIEDGVINFLYIYNSNPCASLPNQNRFRRAIKNNDLFIVVHDIFKTDTADYADVVLPSNTFFERTDIVDSYYHNFVNYNKKVTDRGEGKSNYEVTKMIAKELGIKNNYLYESEPSVIKKVLKENKVSLKTLKEKGFAKKKYENKKDEYSTPSGKIELYSQRAEKRSLNPIPQYKNHNNDKFRLISPTYLHTTTSQYHNTYKKIDERLHIHPKDAEEKNISENEKIQIKNKFGKIKTRAHKNNDTQRGVVFLYKAFWPKITGWNVNFLTNDEKNTKYGNSSTYHSTCVNISKK